MSTAAEYAARATSAHKWKVEPRRPGVRATLVEVWRHRRFIRYLGHQSLRKIYQRTALGWSWLLIRPLFPITLRALVFGGLFAVPSDGVPYFLFLTVGSLLWDVFAGGLSWGARGLEMHRGVLAHVYLPLVILPIATLSPVALDLAISAAIVAVTAIYYLFSHGTTYLTVGVQTLWSVAGLVLTLLLVFAISMFTAPWGEKARDARLVMAQVQAIWFLLTPILYPLSAVPPEYRGWMLLNPLASFIEAFKYGLFGTGDLDTGAFAIASAMTLTVLALGFVFFGRREAVEAD